MPGISKDDALTYLSLTDAKLYIFFDLANYFIKKAEKCCHFNKNNEKCANRFPIHAFLWDGDVHVANKRKGIVGGEDTAFPVTLESCLEGLVAFLHYYNLALGGRCDLHTLQVVILSGLSVSINFNILDAT